MWDLDWNNIITSVIVYGAAGLLCIILGYVVEEWHNRNSQ